MTFNKKFNHAAIYNDILALREAYDEGVGDINDDCYIVHHDNMRFISPCHLISYVAYKGHTEVLEFLLQKGGDSAKSNKDGTTPIYIAMKANQTESTNILLKYSALKTGLIDPAEIPGVSTDPSQSPFVEEPLQTTSTNETSGASSNSDLTEEPSAAPKSYFSRFYDYWFPTGASI